MDKQRLLQTLADLRAEVAQAESVDAETAELLESAMRDLQSELDRRGVKQAADIEPASTGLKDALLKFESEHPQLSVAVGKVADALAAMGI
jgi:ABC-type transporter Mla subunit MlaD